VAHLLVVYLYCSSNKVMSIAEISLHKLDGNLEVYSTYVGRLVFCTHVRRLCDLQVKRSTTMPLTQPSLSLRKTSLRNFH